jgi:hypothetical protein
MQLENIRKLIIRQNFITYRYGSTRIQLFKKAFNGLSTAYLLESRKNTEDIWFEMKSRFNFIYVFYEM